jgi:hypothetical protein
MALNEEWGKWCFASICKHFADELGSDKVLIVEGQQQGPKTDSEVYELRIEGPLTTELPSDEFKLEFEVNILIKSASEGGNIYSMVSLVGDVTAMFTCIPILKLGPEVSDDGSSLGEFLAVIRKRGQESIRSFNFGQVGPDVKEQQRGVEATYAVTLTGA